MNFVLRLAMRPPNGYMNRSVVSSLVVCLMGCGESTPLCSDQARFVSAVSAGCLVNGDAGILLVRDWSGHLALPGGSVERDESAHCGAEREVFEETGLSVAAGSLVTVFDNGFHLFWCDAHPATEPKIRRPLEIKEVGWWQLEQVSDAEWRYAGQGAAIRTVISERTARVRASANRSGNKLTQETDND